MYDALFNAMVAAVEVVVWVVTVAVGIVEGGGGSDDDVGGEEESREMGAYR